MSAVPLQSLVNLRGVNLAQTCRAFSMESSTSDCRMSGVKLTILQNRCICTFKYIYLGILMVIVPFYLPEGEAVLIPLQVTPKSGKTSNFTIWHATAWFLHHLYSVVIQSPCDPETKESLHLTQLLTQQAASTPGSSAPLLCQVKETLQVALEKDNSSVEANFQKFGAICVKPSFLKHGKENFFLSIMYFKIFQHGEIRKVVRTSAKCSSCTVTSGAVGTNGTQQVVTAKLRMTLSKTDFMLSCLG